MFNRLAFATILICWMVGCSAPQQCEYLHDVTAQVYYKRCVVCQSAQRLPNPECR